VIKSKDNQRRVVVTGLGVISSLGIGWEEFWKNLIAGKSGISKITLFDTSKYDRHYGGEVKNFDPTQFMDRRRAQSIGRASQMAIAAAKLALKDARISIQNVKKSKVVVSIGTTMGEIDILEEFNDFEVNGKKFRKSLFLGYPAGTLASAVTKEFGIKNRSMVFSTACAAGNYAVGYAYDQIMSGKMEMGIVGGADALSRITFTGFGRLFAMAPEKCQPFDKNRQGMIVGEGSGILILESLENAKKRNAKIYAEILGYGMSCDAFDMTNPSVNGIEKVIIKTLGNSNISPADIDYISAHGTGTKENDQAECQAMHGVFSKRADKIPMSSIKSMLGHTMGAAAAFESIACCLAVRYGQIPPTVNFQHKDPECNINCVPNKSMKKNVNVVLNNSQAFGGNNACILFRSIDKHGQ
jgi:3-oxoacyl-[acyl-carrier-protein] synthase II